MTSLLYATGTKLKQIFPFKANLSLCDSSPCITITGTKGSPLPVLLLTQPSLLPEDLGKLHHHKPGNPTTKPFNLLTDFSPSRGTGMCAVQTNNPEKENNNKIPY